MANVKLDKTKTRRKQALGEVSVASSCLGWPKCSEVIELYTNTRTEKQETTLSMSSVRIQLNKTKLKTQMKWMKMRIHDFCRSRRRSVRGLLCLVFASFYFTLLYFTLCWWWLPILSNRATKRKLPHRVRFAVNLSIGTNNTTEPSTQSTAKVS